jgi:LPXTG-motif cell wall-anchored protein
MRFNNTSWKTVTRRMIACGTGALMVASLMTPSAAFAAESITVGEDSYYWASAPEGGYSGTGSEGGTWTWSAATELELNNYSGGSINVDGDLTVTYEGTNNVGSTKSYGGINVNETNDEAGDLTLKANGDATLNTEGFAGISSEGSLAIEGGTVTAKSEDGFGIRTGGDLTVSDANVTANANNEDGSYAVGIGVGGSSLSVTNSKINVSAKSKDAAYGVYMSNENNEDAKDSTVLIKDSTLDIVASTVDSKNSFGFAAYSAHGNTNITFDASDVNIKAQKAALYAYGLDASITLNDAKYTTPDNATTFSFDVDDFHKIVAVGAQGATDSDDIATEVVIESTKKDETEPEDEAEVTPASYTKGGEKKLAQTGDASATGMFAAAAAGVTALGAGAFLSRRRD